MIIIISFPDMLTINYKSDKLNKFDKLQLQLQILPRSKKKIEKRKR